MSNIAIKVENLSKVYKLYDKPVDRLKEAINPFRKKYHRDFYALKDINFEVARGETIGIIGKNGSGKSTLLKILTGVLTPTEGKVYTSGKVSALLELGTGFNPELTGMENVYFSGALMGYTKEEINKKIDDIVSFADIGEFINQPVKTYSSGMFVRLAFAVAISVDPEILVVDEALAVGDIRFQQKCFRKIKEFKEKRKTIVFVSHDPATVINYCTKALWLKEGQIQGIGEPTDIIRKYTTYMTFGIETNNGEANIIEKMTKDDSEKIQFESTKKCSSFGEGGAEIQGTALYSSETGEKIKMFKGGEHVIFYIKIKINKDITKPLIGFFLNDKYGNKILGLSNHILNIKLGNFTKGKTIIAKFKFDFPLLKNGDYSFSPAIAEGTQENHIQHHWVHDAYIVRIINPDDAAKIGHYILIKNGKIEISEQ